MITTSHISPQPWLIAPARSAGASSQAGRVQREVTSVPADPSAFKMFAAVHGRADARPSRSSAAAGNEGTGHARLVGLRVFFDAAASL